MLTHLAVDLGFSSFQLVAPADPENLRAFIEEVAPQVRERVAAVRTSSPSPVEERAG